MAFNYGFGKLENELIELFKSGAPDFEKATELINLGADINATSTEKNYDNILAEILIGYRDTQYSDIRPEECNCCERKTCRNCEYRIEVNPNPGEAMVEIIKFFLNNGFDVSKEDGRFGDRCLGALVISTHDAYMLEGAKLLFKAGARAVDQDDDSNAAEFVAMECSYDSCGTHEHHMANLFEAYYQMFISIEEERPFEGIDIYEKAVGKKILKVLSTENDGKDVFFNMNLPNSKHNNCYMQPLYFVYDQGVLIVSEYTETWTDTILPCDAVIDVSNKFSDIVGSEIKTITFKHNELIEGTTHYGQAVIKISMSNGKEIFFTNNHGEEKSNFVAYFYRKDEKSDDKKFSCLINRRFLDEYEDM